MPLRIAMWSGPRNISTALLRSWGNRHDTFVCDEPLYAYYLKTTGVDHPGVDEILAAHESDWQKVAAWLTGPIPEGKTIFYQKHMAHHLLPEIPRDWLEPLSHAFLIREPEEMLTSLIKVLPAPTLADTGLPQQVELFEWVRARTGVTPPVLDARDVLENPRHRLEQLCDRLGVDFHESMLHWAPGRRVTDGVWAKYWYAAVERSSGFEPYQRKEERVPPALKPLLQECYALYEQLRACRLT